MSWRTIIRQGAVLHGVDYSVGPAKVLQHALIFQHGLGGDEAQVADVMPASGLRRLTLECRAQGRSEAGDPSGFAIATFVDDVLAFADACGVSRFAIGGISMGAAIALRIACLHPERVSALILARPAWLWDKAPANMQVFAELAPFLALRDRAGFDASPTAALLARQAPDNLASLRMFFDRPDCAIRAKLIAAISADGAGISRAQISALKTPTLVLGNAIDWIHPLAHAHQLAALIPGARFVEIAPKATDKSRHAAEFKAAVSAFLLEVEAKP